MADTAAFVLIGGRSSRMGKDKAALPYAGGLLGHHVGALAQQAAGLVTFIGPRARWQGIFQPLAEDLRPGQGPLAGIETALSITVAPWNLILACDMPELGADFLAHLLHTAQRRGAPALLAAGPEGLPEPLCAVYHRDLLPAITGALDRGVRKVTQGIPEFTLEPLPPGDAHRLLNLNTPEEWSRHAGAAIRA
ncbi:MAG: molybdenum cofactor guanylyltransferase [Acidobacteria bacterium]|nr:molybdenum cofactor guanylyltransferase [Acidobacteriota bacterium]